MVRLTDFPWRIRISIHQHATTVRVHRSRYPTKRSIKVSGAGLAILEVLHSEVGTH